jgi:Tfp pilus assembly PilM family ATPase
MNSKIYWELSNYFPENYNEFVVNTFRLNSMLPCKDSDDFLIIAVLKNTLEFIKRIFNLCNLNLKLIDIDHFSAEFSFRKGYYGQIENKRVLLVGIKNGRIDFGLIDNGKYKRYLYSKYTSEVDLNLCLIRKLNSIFEILSRDQGIDNIYVYGYSVNNETIETIRKLEKAAVEIVNPFYGINASDLLLHDENLRKNAYKFASSCGAALRSFNLN